MHVPSTEGNHLLWRVRCRLDGAAAPAEATKYFFTFADAMAYAKQISNPTPGCPAIDAIVSAASVGQWQPQCRITGGKVHVP